MYFCTEGNFYKQNKILNYYIVTRKLITLSYYIVLVILLYIKFQYAQIYFF